MVVQRGLVLERHNQLIGYNGHSNSLLPQTLKKEKVDYVFECYLTVDERYFVLQDEVFDIQEQTTLGNIWDSIDNFKTVFRNVSIDNPDYKEIQEGWESLPILEGVNDLHVIKDFLIQEGFVDWMKSVGTTVWNGVKDAGGWIADKVVDAGKSIAQFAKDSWEGIKSLGIAISKGDWSEILRLLGRGALWVLRKLKDAAYSTLGIIVDAILVATGVGKGWQMGIWGLITALDVYQLLNDDWPDGDNREPFWKYLDLGFDILGLVFAGVAAKGARAVFMPLRGLKMPQMAAKVAKSPTMKKLIRKIHRASKSAGGSLKSVQKTLTKKWPTGAKFINKILGGFEKVVKKLQDYLGGILSRSNLKNIDKAIKPGKGFVPTARTGKEFLKRAAPAAGIAGGLSYGIERYFGSDEPQSDTINKDVFNTSGGPVLGVELDQDALDI